MVTRKEVAALAGVSEATVSRVLNGVGPMRESTKRRVLAAAERLGYYPNALAQSFARRRSGNLGVVLPYVPKVHLFSAYYFSEILSGIGEMVREKGYDLLLLLRTPDEQPDYAALFRSQRIDACLILGASDVPDEKKALHRLGELGLPFCLVNQRFDGESFSVIDADHWEGSRSAVRHLLDCGCRRIAFLNGPPAYSNSRDRLEGYRSALADAGVPYDESIVFEGNYGRKSGYEAGRAIAERRQDIDAVFAANDRMAIGLIQRLRELDIRPGIELPIVGCDDSDGARITDPPLTSVHVPFYEMGRLAAAKLLDQLSGEGAFVPFRETLPTRLVVRLSSGGAGTEKPQE